MKKGESGKWLEKIFSFLFCLFNEHYPDFTTDPPIRCKRCKIVIIPKAACKKLEADINKESKKGRRARFFQWLLCGHGFHDPDVSDHNKRNFAGLFPYNFAKCKRCKKEVSF